MRHSWRFRPLNITGGFERERRRQEVEQEVEEGFWSYETALMNVSVIGVRRKGVTRWKIVLAGRNLFETRPASSNLAIAKATATRLANKLVRDTLKETL